MGHIPPAIFSNNAFEKLANKLFSELNFKRQKIKLNEMFKNTLLCKLLETHWLMLWDFFPGNIQTNSCILLS